MLSLALRCLLLIVLTVMPSNCSDGNPDESALEIVGDGCQLKEPVYDHSFNFTTLQAEFGHKVENERGSRFEFNVCGHLSKGCGGNKNASACLTKNNASHILGTSHKLIYKNGSIYFSFTGGEKCANGKNFTLNVMLMCDYTLDVQPFNILPTAESECSFYIKWETNYACLPLPDNMKSNTCTVEDKSTGHKFDLMPLSDSNYRSIDRNGSFFIINVCKPVLYGQNAMCPADSSICYVQNKSSDIKHRFLNYGIAQPTPVFENGELRMDFISNEKCNDTANFTSTIYFNCDRSIKFGSPDFMGRKGCNNQFTWQTSLACNSVRPCIAYNPKTAKEYDFNGIAGVYTLQHEAKNYTLGICNKAGSPCSEKDGACEISNGQTISLGTATSDIIFNETWSPYLLYTSGAICNEKNDKRSTKIEFVCATSDMKAGPTIIENKSCQVIIQFVTSIACKDQILCKVESYDNVKYDLTPLISTTENYISTINETLKLNNKNSLKFYLNVCRPLVPLYGLSCPAGSAACKTALVPSSSTPEQEQSLGYPDVSLTLIEDSRAQLKYLRGEACPADPSVQMSTTIDFFCKLTAGKGNPILQSIIDECHFHFDWATNVMCSSHSCKFDANSCDIINDETDKRFNIKTANFTKAGRIAIKANSETYDFDICGSNRNAVTDYAHSTIKVFFDTSDKCGIGGSISVELRLVCSATQSQLELSANKTCSLVLTQETPEICPFLGLAVPPTMGPSASEGTSAGSHTTDATKGRMVTYAAGIITIAMIATVVVSIVCLRDPAKRIAVKNFFRRNAPAVLYRRVDTVEEANLLLPQDSHTDSDDDLII